jgi:TctA family transporter
MTFNLERIRTRDGRTYSFAGIVEGVRTAEGGGDVRVDNEGSVREGENQTQKTVERAAIGTAIGAIIGAIAGGGAGSVYAQGRDELELRRGTEVTIRASGASRGMANER